MYDLVFTVYDLVSTVCDLVYTVRCMCRAWCEAAVVRVVACSARRRGHVQGTLRVRDEAWLELAVGAAPSLSACQCSGDVR